MVILSSLTIVVEIIWLKSSPLVQKQNISKNNDTESEEMGKKVGGLRPSACPLTQFQIQSNGSACGLRISPNKYSTHFQITLSFPMALCD